MKILYASLASAALAGMAPAPEQDSRLIVGQVQAIIAADYVVTDKREPLRAVLERGLRDGRYNAADPADLTRAINADLAALSNDAHLSIRYSPDEAAAMAGPRDDDEDTPDPFMDELARRWNHGLVEQRVLEGNIRYLNYRGFMWSGPGGRDSRDAMDGAMSFLRGGDAIIIDLRENGGGDPRAVRHLASVFVPAHTKLVTFHMRSRRPQPIYTETAVPGGRIVGKPVYVLTSSRTVSASEEFAAHVRHFGFGTLVGEPTRGGAYRNALYPIVGRYVLSVSIGRPELTDGTNWEGRGISPKIAVPAADALEAALAAAYRDLAARSSSGDRVVLDRLGGFHQAMVTPVEQRRPFAEYTGRYGSRTVKAGAGQLTMQRDGGPASVLVALDRDRFALSLDPTTQVRFVGDASITGLEIDRADGRRETAGRETR